MTTAMIIIMEICKASTLRLKALNKHTHIMYIEMEKVIKKKKKKRKKKKKKKKGGGKLINIDKPF